MTTVAAVKVQCTLIMRIFRGMVIVSGSIPALSKSLGQIQPITFHPSSTFGPIHLHTFAYSTSGWEWKKQALKSVVDGNSESIFDNERDFGKNVSSFNAKRAIEGSSEHGHDESSRAFAKFPRPRPQQVPWQKESANTVHLIGVIDRPVTFTHTKSGYAYAHSVLRVENSPEDEPMRLNLMFWNQLAESAAQHLFKNYRVYVSGHLTSETLAGENDKPRISYKVIVNTLNFVPWKSPAFSEQVVVNENAPSMSVSKQLVSKENTPSPFVSQPTLSYGVIPFQYQRSQIKSSSSGKKSGENAAFVRSSWEAFFNNPDDWWDNRQNKRNPRSPDFKHKDTGVSLWINNTYTPPWVKSMLAMWVSRMKVPEEQQGGRFSPTSQGSLSSFRDGGLSNIPF